MMTIRNIPSHLAHGLAVVALLPAFAFAETGRSDDNAPLACVSGPATNAARPVRGNDKALDVVGLTTDGALVCFGDRKPDRVRSIGQPSGFTGGDQRLVGMDFRPQDGLLYGVGNAGGLYRIDTTTGALSEIGRLSTPPDPAAKAFGVDFNPAANALRIVADTGQNLRQSFANVGTANALAATATDGTLGYTASSTAGPTANGVAGAAYTNNDLSAPTGTTLFVLDVAQAQVAVQSPANAGFLVAIGKLGTATGTAGFDIYSVVRGDATLDQRALAALTVDGRAKLHEVDLLTGRATERGEIGANVVDIAVPLNQY